MSSILIHLYSHGASTYSLIVLLAGWVYHQLIGATTRGIQKDSGFARFYYGLWILRVPVALIQVLIHNGLWFPRIDPIMGRALMTTLFLKFGDPAPESDAVAGGLILWSKYLSWCNIAMAIWMFVHSLILMKMGRAHLVDDGTERDDTMVQGGIRKANFEARRLHRTLIFLEGLGVGVLWSLYLFRGVIFFMTGTAITIQT